jgi:hypothetical protein
MVCVIGWMPWWCPPTKKRGCREGVPQDLYTWMPRGCPARFIQYTVYPKHPPPRLGYPTRGPEIFESRRSPQSDSLKLEEHGDTWPHGTWHVTDWNFNQRLPSRFGITCAESTFTYIAVWICFGSLWKKHIILAGAHGVHMCICCCNLLIYHNKIGFWYSCVLTCIATTATTTLSHTATLPRTATPALAHCHIQTYTFTLPMQCTKQYIWPDLESNNIETHTHKKKLSNN